MLSVYSFDQDGPHDVEDPGSIGDLVAQPGVSVWADLFNPTTDDIDRVEEELGLHPLAIEDVTKKGQRPKLELYDDHVFLVAYAACECNDDIELIEVDVFLGPNWLLTIHDRSTGGAEFSGTSVRERLDRAKKSKRKDFSGSVLLYVVLDEIVDTYFGAVDHYGQMVDEMEERIFADIDPERDELPIQKDMLAIRKALLEFRRKIVPLREVLLQLLRDDVEWVSSMDRHYYQDVLDHIMRVTDEIDTRRELIGNAVDAHLAMVSNHMNQIMKKMTSWGAILIVATLIAGIYGMNFDDMPELHWRYGYFGALTIMLLITVSLYAYFKRKRWL